MKEIIQSSIVLLFLLSAVVHPQEQAKFPNMVVGEPVTRELRGGEEHVYTLTLKAGEYARIAIEQKGIDVVLTLFDADRKPFLEVDNNLSGTSGLEILSLVAENSGAYNYSVRALDKGASLGRYEWRIDDHRPATEADRTRVAAERAYAVAAKLQSERTGESRRKAIEKYTEALRLMRDARDRRGEAMALTNIGLLHNVLGEPQKATEHFDQALTLWHTIGDRHLEALTLSMNAGVYYQLGESLKALDSYRLALPVMRAAGDQKGEARTFSQIGAVYRQLGEPQKALDHFAQSLPLYKAVGDNRNEATVLNNMGTVYNLLNDTQKAFHYLEQALPLARAANDRRVIAITLSNIGTLYNQQGDSDKALKHLNEAITLAREIDDRKAEAPALTHAGTAYSNKGE
ncbi:MAG TPA: tetratricopeptide repeat protein, partial [Pyrinomonadaceae bacterium]